MTQPLTPKDREAFKVLTRHHAECHQRFKEIEQHMHDAAALVPRDTVEGAAWHARHAELKAWRAQMYDSKYAGNEAAIQAYVRELLIQ